MYIEQAVDDWRVYLMWLVVGFALVAVIVSATTVSVLTSTAVRKHRYLPNPEPIPHVVEIFSRGTLAIALLWGILVAPWYWEAGIVAIAIAAAYFLFSKVPLGQWRNAQVFLDTGCILGAGVLWIGNLWQ